MVFHPIVHIHCNPLQGKYRFFTGNSLCSNSTLTCFGSAQGLKGQISLKYMHSVQGISIFCLFPIISKLYEHSFPVLFTGFSLFFQNSMLLFFKEQGNPCYKNINMNVTIKCYIPVQNAYISLYFNEICTLQTLYTAKACKGGNTTQGIPCKKPVLSL